MLANGTFQNFIDTGGYSPTDVQNIRARSLSPLASTFSNANDSLAQSRSLQGGYSPNVNAAIAQNARNLGYASADASTNVEAQLAESIRSGKEWGAQGMSTAGTNLADLTQRGKLSATTGMAQTALAEQSSKLAVQQLDDQMRLSGAQGLSDQEKTTLMAELQNAQINEQAGAANTASQTAKALAQFGASWQLPLAASAQQLTNNLNLSNLSAQQGSMLQNAQGLYAGNINQQGNENLGYTNAFINSQNLPSGTQSWLSNIGQIMNLGSGLGNALGTGTGSGLGAGPNGGNNVSYPGMGSVPGSGYGGPGTPGYPDPGTNPMIPPPATPPGNTGEPGGKYTGGEGFGSQVSLNSAPQVSTINPMFGANINPNQNYWY